jgi:putative ABC transport system permease protein
MRWWLKIRKRRALDLDLREEIAFHRAMRARDAKCCVTDIPPFGNETRIQEEMRDMWSFVWIETAWRDVCYALRGLRRNPGFTAVALLTLAIGIGANTAVFSVVDGILIKPLAYPDADRLVGVWQTAPGTNGVGAFLCSPSMYFTYREESQTFQSFGLATTGGASVTGIGEPEQARNMFATQGALQALGVQPILGRLFTEADDTPGGTDPDPVILNYGYWQSHFGGDKSVLGRTMTVDSTLRQIVGVMPAGFRFLNVEPELITTARLDRSKVYLGNFFLQGVARLKPGVTLQQANADLGRVLEIWKNAWPGPPGGKISNDWQVRPALRPLKQDVVGDTGNSLWVLMGTISMVLLISCANVANLLLVRTQSRQQELAVRASLGASGRRIAGGLFIESMVLGLAGGAAGIGLAYAGLRLLVRIGPSNLPRLNELAIDWRTLSFALCASVFSGVLFSVMPVLKGAGPRIATALRGMARTSSQSKERHRASNVLVVAQVALALILLISSGLMIRTFQALRNVEPGFTKPESIQIFRIWLPGSQVQEPDQVVRTEVAIRDQLAAIPGVTAVAFSNTVPLDGRPSWDPVWAEDKVYASGQAPPTRTFRFVSPGFFAATGTKLMAGRDITWTEFRNHSPVALVSATMARELWGTPPAALGKRIHEPGPKPTWREIVGVIQDVRNRGVQFDPTSMVYFPAVMENGYGNPLYVQRPVAYTIRTDRAGTQSFLTEARAAVWSVNSNLPVFLVSTMKDLYDQSLAATSFTLVILAIAGTMALLLGIIGIYGVMSYAVSQRTREMGIRLALGAAPGQVKRMFVGNGLALAGAGILIGLSAAAGLTRLMKSLLFGISALDPVIYVAMPVVLVAAALLASYLPARRASRIDPSEALRLE